MANISFGKRMRRARIQIAWTQAELGMKIGVSGPTISNWETGKIIPDAESKRKIRVVLGLEHAVRKAKGSDARTQEPRHEEDDAASAPSAFGAWLNRKRQQEGISVAELEEISGVSQPAIYAIEAGRITNPRAETIKRLEEALGQALPDEAKEELKEEFTIEGIGEFIEFDPLDEDDRPTSSGIYVFYDVSQRPIYVGETGNIKKRIKDHEEKFWFRSPIVAAGAYIQIDETALRRRIEKILIKFLKSNAVFNKQNVER